MYIYVKNLSYGKERLICRLNRINLINLIATTPNKKKLKMN